MARHRRNFGQGLARSPFEDGASEDVDPSSFLSNLSDCMLVLAVGFMVALVAAWNVDLPNTVEVQTQEMNQVDNLEKMTENTSSGNGYSRLGEVYQDPETGKMYMITQDDD